MSGGLLVQPPIILTGSPLAAAQRLLRSAAKGITPISTVMAVQPTITQGAAFANSTIQSGKNTNLGGGLFNTENPFHATIFGGPADNGAFPNRSMTCMTVSATGARFPGHSSGTRFATRSATFDVCFKGAGANCMIYATDLSTGIRARVAAADIIPGSTNQLYINVDFGSAAYRIIEVFGGTNWDCTRGINVPSTETVWPVTFSDQPYMCLMWDSWGAGVITDTGVSSTVKLSVPDYIGERLGICSPYCSSVGGTGLLNNASTRGTYQDRLNNGDLDVSRVGNFDIIYCPPSTNDAATVNGAYTDAAVQAAYTTTLQSLRVKQPRALIIGSGPQNVSAQAALQSRYDVSKAGFLAAAGGDPSMIYLNNSPSGENWYPAGIAAQMIGSDNLHPTLIGAQYYGYRIADSIIAAVKARYSI